MKIKDKRYPICSKHELLRKSYEGKPVVISTGALHALLGGPVYQRCRRESFTYRRETSPGPQPGPIEVFLLTDPEARRRLWSYER